MPKLQSIKGAYDLFGSNLSKFNQVKALFRQYCENYGYHEIETPVFEDLRVFKREGDTSDMVNKEMYVLGNDNKMGLRPEGTAGIIRAYVEHKMYVNEAPYKLFYAEKMYRKERPQKGRQREFNQIGVENLGPKKAIIDAETIALGYYFIKLLGLNDIEVLINTLGDYESRKNYTEALKVYFGHNIECLCDDCKKRLHTNPLRILDCKVDNQNDALQKAPKIDEYLTVEAKNYFKEVLSYLDILEIPYKVEQRLVRGLDYYTDTVFEVVSTNEASGAQSTLFGGGRYDNLVEYFEGPATSGIGFAMGLERLIISMEAEGVISEDAEEIDTYIIDLTNSDPYVLKVASILRNNGFKVELNVYDRKLKAQFKSVARLNAKTVIIIGEDEIKEATVMLKNIETQEQIKVNLDELVDKLEEMVGNDIDE